MITLDIDPVAFTVGSVAVPWYAVTLVTAVITVLIIARGEVRRLGFRPANLGFAALWMIAGGLLGAKIGHVIDWWDYYSAHPARILSVEGWVIHGAILGALLALGIYARISRTSFRRWCDVAAVGAPLGQAIGRIGCLIQGCCYGLPTTLPWAVVYTHPRSYAPRGEPIHPTQVYFLVWNLIVFAALQPLRGRLQRAGSLFLVYLALYTAGDFGLRFLRPGEPVLLGLQQAQVISLAILIVVVPLLATGCIAGRRGASESEG